MNSGRVLVTGATGFIGGRLNKALLDDGVDARSLCRCVSHNAKLFATGDLLSPPSLLEACDGVDTVFHCAGYAHAFHALNASIAQQHWKVNFEGTRNLLLAAGQSGVKRFIFLSSVKAMGEPGEQCVDEGFSVAPETAYGQSKLAAEHAVIEAGQLYGMHVVNLRLAMVYGFGGRGNLERMGQLVRRGLFPPLPETGNHRSLVHVDDVISALRLVSWSNRANGQTYIIANQDAPSGRALFDALRRVQGLSPCGWSVPASFLWGGARVGDWLERLLRHRCPLNSEVVERLLQSAWYSPMRIHRELGWQARVSLIDGLSEMLKL